MSTGDEPALGGQSDDNVPMISSVQTRAIADARGAYTVGNLHALFNQMSGEQRDIFEHAVIRHAWELRARADGGEIRIRNPEARDMASYVERWLDQPSVVRSQDVIERAISELDRFSEWDGIIFDFVQAIIGETWHASRFAVALACVIHNFGSLAHRSQVEKIVTQWHLDIAWALIQGRNLPPYPVIDVQAADAAISDLSQMFKERNLDALIFAFTEEQASQFRNLIFSQALSSVKKVLPRSLFHRTARSTFAVLSKWHTDAAVPDQETYSRLLGELNQRTYRHEIYPWLKSLLIQVYATEQDVQSQNAPDTLSRLAEAVWHAISGAESRDKNRTPITYIQAESLVRAWQLEAAWAILHDDPIPPLELTP
jgi:hypothetical protein